MIKPQDLPLFQETPIWLWPALWWQLQRLHDWIQKCANHLGEPVDAQYCVIKGRIYLIRVSDNISGAGKQGWQGTGHKSLTHLVQPLGPCSPVFARPALRAANPAAPRACAEAGLFAPMPLRLLGPG